MQTQYHLLYRYMNESTNTAVTNEAKYEKVEEFFNAEHKFNLTTSQIDKFQKDGYNLKYTLGYNEATSSELAELKTDYVTKMTGEADTAREQLIVNEMSNQEKSNLLFAYNGTKRHYHKKFIPEQIGYKVREWTRVPKDQIPSGPDDFSKHFVMLGGNQLGIDDAYLVCKPQFIDIYKKYHIVNVDSGATDPSYGKKCFLCLSGNDRFNKGYKKNIDYFHRHTYLDDLKEIIDQEVMFEWYDFTKEEISDTYYEQPIANQIKEFNDVPYSQPKNMACIKTETGVGTVSVKVTRWFYFFWNNTYQYVPGGNSKQTSNPTGTFVGSNVNGQTRRTGWELDQIIERGSFNISHTITINDENIIKDTIPEHYEDTDTNAYYIKDEYVPIPLSPWMLHSIHASLESALESAKKLVSMVGIDNVKLVKHVPLDQFIKIK